MASGSGLATALAALKAHAVAATVVGALVVGGGAATVAVTTGTVHVPGVNTHSQATKTDADAASRATACASNGDATRLAGIFSPMFGGDKTLAQKDICSLFVGTNGHGLGLGEVQQALEITAAIEKSGSNACLTAAPDHGQPTTNGKPPTAGTPQSGNGNDKGSQGSGQTTFSAPQESATTTMGIVSKVLDADGHGTPLAQLAKNCGAVSATGNTSDNGNTGNGDNGNDGNGHPNGTPTAKPTGTPGHGHP